jgi:hypothetical protein
MRNGRAVGAAIGVGAIAGLFVFLTRSSRASAAIYGSPRERTQGPLGKFPSLVERWRYEVAKRAQDLPVDAILEWIRIESGGDMCSPGLSNEVGIFQLMFPGDAKYGATLDGLRVLCQKSKTQNPRDISWLSEAELDMDDAADKIRETINGVGDVHFNSLGEFLKAEASTAKQAVLSHLGYVKRYPAVYGGLGANQMYEQAWR